MQNAFDSHLPPLRAATAAVPLFVCLAPEETAYESAGRAMQALEDPA